MTWFLFGGDMLVMLFMVGLVIWVTASPAKKIMDFSASIPLADDPQDIERFGKPQQLAAQEDARG